MARRTSLVSGLGNHLPVGAGFADANTLTIGTGYATTCAVFITANPAASVTVPTTVTGLPFNVTAPGNETATPAAVILDPANGIVPLNPLFGVTNMLNCAEFPACKLSAVGFVTVKSACAAPVTTISTTRFCVTVNGALLSRGVIANTTGSSRKYVPGGVVASTCIVPVYGGPYHDPFATKLHRNRASPTNPAEYATVGGREPLKNPSGNIGVTPKVELPPCGTAFALGSVSPNENAVIVAAAFGQ